MAIYTFTVDEDKMDKYNFFDGLWCKKCTFKNTNCRDKPCVNCIYEEDRPSEFVERKV